MDCACLFKKICGYGYYKIETTEIFNEKNFWTTRKSYKFEEKIAMPFVLGEDCRKGFNFCWTLKANVEPKLA